MNEPSTLQACVAALRQERYTGQIPKATKASAPSFAPQSIAAPANPPAPASRSSIPWSRQDTSVLNLSREIPDLEKTQLAHASSLLDVSAAMGLFFFGLLITMGFFIFSSAANQHVHVVNVNQNEQSLEHTAQAYQQYLTSGSYNVTVGSYSTGDDSNCTITASQGGSYLYTCRTAKPAVK